MASEAASPPPSMLSEADAELGERLDEDIARVRAEIQTLTKRRSLLSASLLSSTKVQSALRTSTTTDGTNLPLNAEQHPLLLSQVKHNQSNIYRLAFGVTAFPFHDPNPEITTNPLLGIRFDIPSRSGTFERAPYYIFCKKNPSHTSNLPATTLSIHHHTIPALIPLQVYSSKYLPQPTYHQQPDPQNDGGVYGSVSPSPPSNQDPNPNPNPNIPKQNLHALVSSVRNDLTSWIQRQEAITYTCETLIPTSPTQTTTHLTNSPETQPQQGKFGISSISATGHDARFIRLVWIDGRVGRLKLSDQGYIIKAAVFGDTQLREVERMLSTDKDGGQLHIIDLVDRIEEVEKEARAVNVVRTTEMEMEPQTNDNDQDVEMNDEDEDEA